MIEKNEARYAVWDGLRGWAALAVVFWHLFVEIFGAKWGARQYLVYVTPMNGIVAVYLFFIISGFALSIAYLRNGRNDRLVSMISSRYPRLTIPIFMASLGVMVMAWSGVIPPALGRPIILQSFLTSTPSLGEALKFSFFDVFFAWRLDRALIAPLWTMPIELNGSIIVFSLLMIVGRFRMRLVVFVLSFTALLFLQSIYTLFLGGMIIAELSQIWRPRSRWQLFSLYVALAIGLLGPALTHNEPSRLYYITCLGLAASALWLEGLNRFFTQPLSRFLGWISFPLYLVHGPVIYSFSVWTYRILLQLHLGEGVTNLLVASLTVPVAIAAAVAFAPINDSAVKLSRRFGAFVTASLGFGPDVRSPA